jgi:NCS2 family nucleobase:cation symporter-2
MKKPADLIYGVDERPPLLDSVVVALQHVLVIAVNLIYPLLLARQAGLSGDATAAMLRIGMVALAAGVLLQAIPRGPVGCHYLAPAVYASPFLAPGFLAIEVGGMPLFWGMTITAGLAMLVFASIWGRLRTFIPPESAGLVVFLVGATIGVAALRLLHRPDGTVGTADSLVTLIALAVMITFNVWGKGRLRLFSILVGLVCGYIVAAVTGLLEVEQFREIANQPVISMPSIDHMAWSFDVRLVIPFAVTALATAMVTTAIVATCQRITDAEWVRPDMPSIVSGIRGDGVSTVIGGLLCSFGLAIGPANAGLVAATGVASRVVAYTIAALLALAGIVPAFAGLLTVMPAPVMAAGLLFPAAFIMINGVQVISSRVLDTRRTVVIGAGILTFLLVAMFPRTFAGAPDWLQSIVGSPLVLATIVALSLNLVFRIGIKRSVAMQIAPEAFQPETVEQFVESHAGGWGARRDVVARVRFALLQAIEAVVDLSDREHPIDLTMSYDEFDIGTTLTYRGEPMELPDFPPSKDEIMEVGGDRLLAGFLVRRQADKAHVTCKDGLCVLNLHFRQ